MGLRLCELTLWLEAARVEVVLPNFLKFYFGLYGFINQFHVTGGEFRILISLAFLSQVYCIEQNSTRKLHAAHVVTSIRSWRRTSWRWRPFPRTSSAANEMKL